MSKIEVELKVNRTFYTEVDIDEVLDAVLELKPIHKWNFIGRILNDVSLNIDDLSKDHKELIEKYLRSKLELFKY